MLFTPISKLTFLLLLLSVFRFSALAQTILLPERRYDQILGEAQANNKLALLLVQPQNELSSTVEQPLSATTSKQIDATFVSGTISIRTDAIDHPLQQQFPASHAFYLFTDAEGYPLLRYNQPITEEKTLLALIDSAKTLAQGETMGKLIKQYKKGQRKRALMTQLLGYYQTFGLYCDQQLLRDYVAQLTIQELDNLETIVFVLRSGPVYGSKIYQLIRTNGQMVDSLYSSLPSPLRKEINNRIIQQTFREALLKKDIGVALSLGSFVRQSWKPNHLRGNRSSAFYPMEYRRLLQDSAAYLSLAKHYYNQHFYRVDTDSIAKFDFAANNKKEIPLRGPLLDSAENEAFQQWIPKARAAYAQDQAASLYYGAQQQLAYGIHDPEALFDGIRWQQKAIALSPGKWAYHHTLAKLLYHVGFFAQAAVEQQQAINLSKAEKRQHAAMQEGLKQLQKRLW